MEKKQVMNLECTPMLGGVSLTAWLQNLDESQSKLDYDIQRDFVPL